jgi:hypothetical protein
MIRKALFNLEEVMQLVGGTAANTAKVLARSMGDMPELTNVLRELYQALAEGRRTPFNSEDGRANVELMEQVWARMPAERTRIQADSA